MATATFTRDSDQCYISGRKFTQKDVNNGDVIYYDGRPCFVGYHGIPQSDAWKERNAARLEAERIAAEKRQKELDELYGGDDW
jgi:hypothetical protein